MEILSSGSFINLENQEKIEQLKFTAAELANAALESSGFVNEEEPARALSLEFWQGLEYMCRESERDAIQNIFLNHFLERLREHRAPLSTNRLSSPNDSQIDSASPIESRLDSEDEFLGVIGTIRSDAVVSEDFQTQPEENSNITDDFSAEEDDSVEDIEIETAETFLPESEASLAVLNPETETSDSKTEVQEKAIVSSNGFALPKKEPYQFNKCTVTVAVQLLPMDESSNSRKAVLSVRTHDFAPNISLVELDESNLTDSMMPELEKVLATYKSDLPLKVMNKMKKEKISAKRNAPKPNTQAKTVSPTAAKSNEVTTSQSAVSETAQMPSPVIPQPAQTGLQGSLFG
ncbi:MAG TPA: hypothetical protein PKE69_16625 [Pyrinomonadaceae bacterium]|nr:hypothetical protein [Pyrinomonadaceae bacterium]